MLYHYTLYPLESILEIAFVILTGLSGSYFWSLVALAVLVRIFTIPLERFANISVKKQIQIESVLGPQIETIKQRLSGEQRHEAIRRLYSRYSYHPVFAARSLFGLAVQLPFFIAAFYMISESTVLQGVIVPLVGDLGQQDKLLLGSINLLPFIMTGVNLLVVFTTPDLNKKESIQGVCIALLFLILLYSSPAALLIYWSVNQACSLSKNIIGKFVTKPILQPNFLKRHSAIVTIVFTSACLPLLLFLLLPVETYWSNRSEFICEWQDVVLAGTPFFALFFVFFASILLILRRVSEKTMVLFTSLLVMLTFLLMLESWPLSYRLPELDGNLSGYEFGWRSVFDGLIWITLLGVGIRFKNIIFDWAFRACLCITVSCLISITVIQLNLNLPKSLANITPLDVMNVTGFNQDNNVLLLSMDMMHSRTVQKILVEHPDMRSRLTGFTNFTNNITQHGSTQLSVPSLLHGQLFDGVDFFEHRNKVYTSEHSLLNHFIEKNFSIFMNMGSGLIFTNQPLMNKDASRSEIRLYALGTYPLHIQDLTFFRILPLGLKSHFLQEARVYTQTQDTKYISKKEKDFYVLLSDKTDNLLSTPTLHAYHTAGGHYPFYLDAKGQLLKETPKWSNVSAYEAQVIGLLTSVLDFIDLLKEKGLYDQSTIILTSDHGYEYYPEEDNNGIYGRFTPMLIVKPRGAQKPYTENDAPMSSGLLSSLVGEIAQHPDPENHFAQYIRTLPKERVARNIDDGIYIDYYFDEQGKYTTKTMPIQEVAINKLKKWSMGTTYSSSAHSDAEPIPTLYTKGINRNGGVGFAINNNKDGEVRLLAPSGADLLDLTLSLYSTVTGEMTVTNQNDGEKYPVKLLGGDEDFQRLDGRVNGLRVQDDGILHLLFEVSGEGTYIAFREWTFTPSSQVTAME
jgi:membrane protein insertase Oxa1/YidC/SpoIIIJ